MTESLPCSVAFLQGLRDSYRANEARLAAVRTEHQMALMLLAMIRVAAETQEEPNEVLIAGIMRIEAHVEELMALTKSFAAVAKQANHVGAEHAL